MTSARIRPVLLLLSLFCILLAACGDPALPTSPPLIPPSATTAPEEPSATAAPVAATAIVPAAAPTDTESPMLATVTTPPDPPTEVAPSATTESTNGTSGNGASPTQTLRQLATVTPIPVPPTATVPPLPTNTNAPPQPTNTSAAPTNTSVPPTPTAPVMLNSWEQSLPGIGEISILVNDPVTPSTVYAGGPTGVARSTDGGRTWTVLTRVIAASQIAIAPSDSKVIYAGTGIGCASGIDGQLYRSADGGQTWKSVTGGPDNIDINPTDPNRLVALSCDGVYRSTDGGVSWAKLPGSGIENLDGWKMARGVNDRTVIYAAYVSEGGSAKIHRTLDDARTWEVLDTPEFSLPNDLRVDPFDARHVYFVSGSGFYSSGDAGQNFNAHNEGLQQAETGNYALSNLAIDLISPPPTRARYNLYLFHFVYSSVSGLVRWNGSDAWEKIGTTPYSQPFGGQLLVVNDTQAPALLSFIGDRVYRQGLGR